MRQTCGHGGFGRLGTLVAGMDSQGELCGKPAVDYVAIMHGEEMTGKLWLCAEHLDAWYTMLHRVAEKA